MQSYDTLLIPVITNNSLQACIHTCFDQFVNLLRVKLSFYSLVYYNEFALLLFHVENFG